MKISTACRTAGRWLVVCLLLGISQTSFAQCPDYPRAMDQVYVCYNWDNTLNIEQNATLHNPVRFTFPTFPPDATVLFDYDADDANPLEIIASGEIKTVTYPAPGQYRIYWGVQWISGYETDPSGNLIPIYSTNTGYFTFQTNFNNIDANYSDFLPHQTWGDIVGNTYTPLANGAYPPGSPNTLPVNSGGIVHILYANPDHQMRKPLIFVEGFDPILETSSKYMVTNPNGETLGFGRVRWDVIVTGRNEEFDVDPTESGVPHTPQFALMPTLIQGLRSRGYDIVYVDFADAGTYIQANAEFLINVIERVNSEKITDEESVLIGASMGGIVSRYALAKMENEGNNHCIGLFGTFDTPHNGANIPLATQAFGWFFHATGTNDLAWLAMDTPAARQQLVKHLGSEIQSGNVEIQNAIWDYCTPLSFDELNNSNYGALRNQLKGELESLGWPKQPRKIALLDGMKNGTLSNGQGYGPGDKFYDVTGEANALNFDKVFKILMRSSNGDGIDQYFIEEKDDCHTNVLDVTGDEKLLFAAAKPHDFNPCNPLGQGAEEVPYKYNIVHLNSTSELPHLDNAPGGFRLDLRLINAQIKSSLESSGVEVQNPVKFPISTFVPTWSGLAMGTELTNTNLFVDLMASEFAELNLPNAKVPNFDNFYAPEVSLRHVELDGGMVAFIFEELDRKDAGPDPGILSEVYNYGEKYKQIPNTTVSSTGVLNVNNPGPTGYVQSNPQGNATKPIFTTYLNSCGQIITVENGGQYNIGALDKSQHGITEVWNGATVHIKSGGILRITSEQSKLWIKHGATLILDAGAIVNLESSGSQILIQGDLVVNGDIQFTGLGYFNFEEGNQLVFGPGYSTFNLSGVDKAQRFVRLSADVLVDNGHRLNWRNGLMEVGAGTLHITDGAGLDFNFMTITGAGGGYAAIDAFESGAITLQDSKVEQLGEAINGAGGIGCNILSCEFSDNTAWGVWWDAAYSVRIENSIFDGGNVASRALLMTNVTLLTLEGSLFFDFVDNSVNAPISDSELDGAAPAVDLSNMVACLVKNCVFTGNTIGIKASDPNATANVFAHSGSSFVENSAAIYVNGNTGPGTVLADCVKFDRNSNGIRGRDIALMIDSWNSKLFEFDHDQPNKFIRDNLPQTSDDHVRICYQLKGVGGSNRMRNNLWLMNDGGVLMADPDPASEISLMNAACSANIVLPLFTPFSSKDPLCVMEQRPLSFTEAFPSSECMLSVGGGGTVGSTIRVHEQFHLGTFLMRSDSVEAGIEAMRPVAALWQSDMSSLTDNCQQYVRVAKAFVEASDNHLPGLPRPNVERASSRTTGNLIIAPNPASQSAMLQLSQASHQIRVWDAQGNVRLQTTASGSYRLETSDWVPGIYFVEAVALNGDRKRGKLVVHR